MRRIGMFLIAVTIVLAGYAPPSHAATVQAKNKFTGCESLNKKFPRGIAKSRASADFAAILGYRRPKVSPSVYKLNKRLDVDKDGFLCVDYDPSADLDASESQSSDVTSATAPPPAVANLTVIANPAARGDSRATFNIGWQMPSAANFSSFEVRLQDGSTKFVQRADGVSVTPDVIGFTTQGFGPFGATVGVTVTPFNLLVPGPAASASLVLPAQPKSTYTVEISVGSGPCDGFLDCYVSWTNSTGAEEWDTKWGSWSYEASQGMYVKAYVSTKNGHPSTCTIKVEGVVASTQSSDWSDAFCSTYVR